VNKKEPSRAQADTCSATPADLRRAVEDLVLRRQQPGEGIMTEARRLARQWKVRLFSEDWPRPLFDWPPGNMTLLLAGLVVAFRRDHQLLEQIRRRLKKVKLSDKSLLADTLALYLPRIQAKLTPKQAYETKRRMQHWRVIEWEYGGTADAELGQRCLLSDADDPAHSDFAPPTCLDGIFAGDRVNMLRLQELFGKERHQFPKKLPSISKGRETWYDYRAVAMIMDALLSEKRQQKRNGSGRPPRKPWLNDPRSRTRVLRGIEARLNSFPAQGHIKAAFLIVLGRHLPDSGRKSA